MQKIVFLDRDGVINIDKHYLYKIEDFEFIDGILELLIYLQKLGYKLIIITNQSGIGRGFYSIEDLDRLHSWLNRYLKNRGIDILDILYCPHTPLDNCQCRKPNIGMINIAKGIVNIDFEKSWLIGDKESDIETAINANIRRTILLKSKYVENIDSKATYLVDKIIDIKDIIKD